MVKLTKKFIDNRHLRINDQWVSNGHWLLHRSIVEYNDFAAALNKDSAYFVFGVVEYHQLSEEIVQKIIEKNSNLPAEGVKPWRYTGFILNENYKHDKDMLVYENKGKSEYALLRREYLDHIGRPETLWSLSPITPFFNKPEKPTICILGQRTQPRKVPLFC